MLCHFRSKMVEGRRYGKWFWSSVSSVYGWKLRAWGTVSLWIDRCIEENSTSFQTCWPAEKMFVLKVWILQGVHVSCYSMSNHWTLVLWGKTISWHCFSTFVAFWLELGRAIFSEQSILWRNCLGSTSLMGSLYSYARLCSTSCLFLGVVRCKA